MPKMRTVTIVVLLFLAIAAVGLVAAIRRTRRETLVRKALHSARIIGLATCNMTEAFDCLPFLSNVRKETPLRWRTTLDDFVDAHAIPTLEEKRNSPAGVFHLTEALSRQSNVYAITGIEAAFSPPFECTFQKMPQWTLLYVSGRVSSEHWTDAGDVSIEAMREAPGSIKELLGEAIDGLTVLIFANGQVEVVDSAIPAALLARQANARDPRNETIPPDLGRYVLPQEGTLPLSEIGPAPASSPAAEPPSAASEAD